MRSNTVLGLTREVIPGLISTLIPIGLQAIGIAANFWLGLPVWTIILVIINVALRQRRTRIASSLAVIALAVPLLYKQWAREHEPAGEPDAKFSKLRGVLLPANDPDPLPECKTGKGDLKLVLGTNAWVNPISEDILRVGSRDRISVKRRGVGIAVDADISGENRNMVAKIRDNKFVLNPNNVFDVQTPDDSTLIVHSTTDGRKVLDVRFFNKTTVRINAVLFPAPGVRFEVDERGMNAVGIPGFFQTHHSCWYKSAGINLGFENPTSVQR